MYLERYSKTCFGCQHNFYVENNLFSHMYCRGRVSLVTRATEIMINASRIPQINQISYFIVFMMCVHAQ